MLWWWCMCVFVCVCVHVCVCGGWGGGGARAHGSVLCGGCSLLYGLAPRVSSYWHLPPPLPPAPSSLPQTHTYTLSLSHIHTHTQNTKTPPSPSHSPHYKQNRCYSISKKLLFFYLTKYICLWFVFSIKRQQARLKTKDNVPQQNNPEKTHIATTNNVT